MPHGTPYSDSSDRDAEKQARCIYFYVALASRSVVTDYIHANVPGEWPSYFNACFLNYAHKILQQKVSGQKDLCDEDLKVIKILEAAFPTTEATEYIRALEIFRTTRWLRTQGAKGSEFVGGVISLEKVWDLEAVLKGRRELYNVLSSRPKRLQDKAQYGDAVFTMASGADYDVADGGHRGA